jgi:restriction endonuclease Mrr
MPIPDYQSLMLPVLEVASKGETSVPLAEADIAVRIGLSDEEREQMLPSGKQRVLHNRIHWAKFYLTKAGLLESPKRGRFIITAAGQQVLAKPPAILDTKHLPSRAFATSTGVERTPTRSPRRPRWSHHPQRPRRSWKPHTKPFTRRFGLTFSTASFKTARAFLKML